MGETVVALKGKWPAPRAQPTVSPPVDEVFLVLDRAWGPQGWWPARTPVEMIVGAILTQNAAWVNVEKALDRLDAARALDLDRLHRAPVEQVAEWIRPAGYFNVKARRLRAFTERVYAGYDGSLDRLLAEEPHRLRRTLLEVNGIGPETADSILLYAAGRPWFVVDAYTRRVLPAPRLDPRGRILRRGRQGLHRGDAARRGAVRPVPRPAGAAGKRALSTAARMCILPVARLPPQGRTVAMTNWPANSPGAVAALALGALLAAGCGQSARPAVAPPSPPVIGEVVFVHPALAYVIVRGRDLPPAEEQATLERAGSPIGKVRFQGPREEPFAVADVVEGEPVVGDQVRRRR